jgi:hypothetical protein
MSRGEEKGKRWRSWRPRFSVRTLAIFVTLVCCYFGAWEVTKRYGLRSRDLDTPWFTALETDNHGPTAFSGFFCEDRSPAPLIVSRVEHDTNFMGFKGCRRYYLWLFGPRIKLPFESALYEFRD